jgi:hypothetical protein
MKVSRETKDILTDVRFDAFELQNKVQELLKRLSDTAGTIKNQKQLSKVLPILECFIAGK